MALRRVFTYLGAVFLMSYIIFCNNASAFTYTVDMSGYGIVNSATGLQIDCEYSDTSKNQTNVWTCGASGTAIQLKRLRSHELWNFQNGDILEFDLLLWTSGVNIPTLDGLTMGFVGSNAAFRVLSVSQPVNNYQYNNYLGLTNGTGSSSDGNNVNSMYHFVFQKYRGDAAQYIGLDSNQTWFVWSGNQVNFRLFNINQYRLTGEGSSDQQNEINATNDSVQQSETEGASSQSDAQTGTASLISTIGSAVSAITTASPTNCLINGNMGNFDMGQIDLCSNPVPAFVQIISSLILILITVPLCIVMFNRFIGLFRSFQG